MMFFPPNVLIVVVLMVSLNLCPDTQESSMFSNAIKNSGAKITTVEDTDYLTWKKDENYDVQEKAKENHMKAVLDEGAKKINGEK